MEILNIKPWASAKLIELSEKVPKKQNWMKAIQTEIVLCIPAKLLKNSLNFFRP